MKTLYLVGGTMGVGKTTVCRRLKVLLPNSVFLDGDWCWDMHPFQITEETKAMVLDNICHLLYNFLGCSAFQNIIFCWVLHEQSILDSILVRLDLKDCSVKSVSLVCDAAHLTARLQRDVERGIRMPDVIGRSLSRVPLYEGLSTVKVDVSEMTAEQAAEAIMKL